MRVQHFVRLIARRLLGRQRGASAIHYALIVALVSVSAIAAMAAMSGGFACTMAEVRSRILGLGAAECTAPGEELPPGNEGPGEPEGPIPDVDLAELAFPDTVAEPAQFAVSEGVRVTGFSQPLQITVAADAADAEPQVSIAGAAWATGGTVSPGQSLRLRLRASSVWEEARVATVTLGAAQASWTVTVRAQDRTLEPAFAFRPTPWSATEGTTVIALVPIAEPSRDSATFAQAWLPQYVPPPNGTRSRVTTVRVQGFDGPLPVRMTVNGLAGAVPMLQRNGGAWDAGTPSVERPGASEVDIFPGDILSFRVQMPPNAFDTAFTVEVEAGEHSAIWEVQTRPADTTPDAMTFPAVEDLAPGDGTATTASAAVRVTGIEWPASFALSNTPPAGAAMRGCDSGGCDPAAEGGGGWSGWGSSATVAENGLLQLRVTVPTGIDALAATEIVAGTQAAPFTARWEASTVTDGPDALVLAPMEGVEPDSLTTTPPVLLAGTVKPVTVAVPAPAVVVNGATVASSVLVRPGEAFRIRTMSAAGFLGEAEDRIAVPVTVSGADSTGATQTWSAGWTPTPQQLFVNRAIDTAPRGFTFPDRDGVEPSLASPSEPVFLEDFDRSLPVTLAGPPGSAVTVGQTRIELGETGSASAGDRLVAILPASSAWGGSATMSVTVGSGGDAVTVPYTVTTRAIAGGPSGLAIATLIDRLPGETVTSETVTLSGLDGPVSLSVSGPSSLRFRTGNAAGWSEADWRVGTATVANGDALQLRVAASTDFEGEVQATVQAGTASAIWRVLTIRNSLSFDAVSGIEPGETVLSNKVLLSGFNGTVALALLGGSEDAAMLVDGTPAGRSATAGNGQSLQLQTRASTTLGEALDLQLSAGPRQASWRVTARSAEEAPEAFDFAPLQDVEPASGLLVSAPVVLTGFDTPLAAVAQGPREPKFSIGDGPFVASGTVSPGDSVRMQVDSPAEFGRTEAFSLRVGTGSGSLIVSSRARRSCPQGVVFPAVTSAASGAEVVSQPLQMLGFDGRLTVTLLSTADAAMRLEGGAWTGTLEVAPEDWLQLRVKVPATGVEAAEVKLAFAPGENCVGRWSVGAQAPLLAFGDALDVEPGSAIALAASPSPVSGAGAGLTLTVSGDAGLLLAKNGAAGAASVTVVDGDSVQLVGTAPAGFSQSRSAIVHDGTVASLVAVTTRAPLEEVQGLVFAADLELEPGAEACHPAVTLSGFDLPRSLTVSGGSGAELRVQGGASGTTVTVAAGDRLSLCFDAPTAYAQETRLTVNGGGSPAQWVTATRAARHAPVLVLDPQPMFDAPVGARVSIPVSIPQIDGPLQASVISAGPGGMNVQPQIGLSPTALGTGPLSVNSGDTVTISLMTAPAIDSWANLQLKIGQSTALWQTYTGPDNVPDAFDFRDPEERVQPGTAVLSETVTLTGFKVPLLAAVTASETVVLVHNGADVTGSSVTVAEGDTLALRMTAPEDYDRTAVATVTVGAYAADTWTVRTRGSDNLPDSFSIPTVMGAEADGPVVSSAVEVKGFDGELPISLSASPTRVAEFSRDGGASWSAGGAVTAGDMLLFRTTANATPAQPVSVTVTVGTLQVSWAIYTSTDPIWQEVAGALPLAPLGESYSYRLKGRDPAGGGVFFTVVGGGSLPAGLTLDSGGDIVGTPTQPGTASFTVRLSNYNGDFVNRSFTLTADGRPAWQSPAAGAVLTYVSGDSFSLPLTATDPENAALVYTLSTGTLPPGLELSGNRIQGTPTQAGSFALTLQATDAAGLSASRSFTLRQNLAPVWATPTGSLGTVPSGSAASLSVSATDDLGAVTYSLVSGALPGGLSFNTDGTITGTASGSIGSTGNFRARATDSEGLFVERDFSVAIGMFAVITSKTNTATTPYNSGAGRCDQPWNDSNIWLSPPFSGTFNLSFEIDKPAENNIGYFGTVIYNASGPVFGGTGIAHVSNVRQLERYDSWGTGGSYQDRIRIRVQRYNDGTVLATDDRQASTGLPSDRLLGWVAYRSIPGDLRVGVYFTKCAPTATVDHTITLRDWQFSTTPGPKP